jgi:hypothetical protein
MCFMSHFLACSEEFVLHKEVYDASRSFVGDIQGVRDVTCVGGFVMFEVFVKEDLGLEDFMPRISFFF